MLNWRESCGPKDVATEKKFHHQRFCFLNMPCGSCHNFECCLQGHPPSKACSNTSSICLASSICKKWREYGHYSFICFIRQKQRTNWIPQIMSNVFEFWGIIIAPPNVDINLISFLYALIGYFSS